jgi:serine O-acetyltransferase
VPADSTVVGIPGRVVRIKGQRPDAMLLDHGDLPDPDAERLDLLQNELQTIAKRLEDCRREKNCH